MSRITIIGILALFSFNSYSQNNNRITLQQAIEKAIANNVQVKQSDLLLQSAELSWKQAKANLLPSLNASATQGINMGRSIDPFTNSYVDQKINFGNYGIGTSVVLFNGFSQQNTIRQNATAYEASKKELQQTKDNITISVILAYLQILNNEDLVQAAMNQADVTQKQLDRLEVMNQQGAVSPPLLADLRGQLMNDKINVLNLQNSLEQSKLSLAQLMNISYDSTLKADRISADEFLTPYTADNNQVFEKAVSGLAMVKAAELRKKSAELGLEAVKGQLYPTLSFNANLNTNYSSVASQSILSGSSYVPTKDYVEVNGSQIPVITKQNNYDVQHVPYGDQLTNNLFTNTNVSLRVPLFNSFQTRNRIKQAKINIKSSELVEENTKLQLRQAIDQAYLNLTNASGRLKLSQEQVAAYNDAYKAAEIRFQSGVGTSVDYIIAKNNLDRANINLIIAKYDFVLRKKVLDYYSGSL